MSNQIVISSGAKVRSLNGVITGTTGVLDALPINAANGIPQLDVNGKILVSQLPNSVMEYQGTWNANTNTPTLTNGGAFNQGDVYLCNVAGTTDFGAGPISFVVGDQVIYSGSIWQRASGSTGTVTSVAVTESGDALTITGSPITTSGTINVGFAGTSAQYVAGNGALVTFPDLTGYVTLTTSQTITGLKTFNTPIALDNALNLKFDASINAFGGYYSLYAIKGVSSGNSILALYDGDTNKKSSLTFDNSNNFNYLFPSASGTVALTSDLTGGTVTSVGLTMPVAFNVASSPITTSGTLAVTAAGYASQYIRGDGTLADFPSSGGGGSSVSYYLNGGTSQGVIGGVTYYEMSKTADTGTGVDFPKNGDGLIVSFLTDANDPAQLTIPGGNWNYEIYVSMSANGGTPQLYAELYKYDGTTFTLISTSSNEILYDGVNLNLYSFAMSVPTTTLTVTDRLAVKLYATNSGGKTTTVHTQNGHLCQVITTFSTGITALNGLTTQVQYLATGTSGTDFNISSATATHTFNLPTASAANRGALSSADWTTFNNKQNALTNPVTGTGTSGQVTYFNGTSSVTGSSNFKFDGTNLTIGNPSSALAQLHVYNASAAATILLQTNSTTDYSEIAVRNNSSTATSYFRQYSTAATGSDFGISRAGLALFFSNYATNFAIGTRNGGDLILGTADTERARITSIGNFGLGTSTPSRDPSGTRSLAISGASLGYAASLDLYATRNYAIYTGGSGSLGFYDLTANAERLTIASTGAATFSSSVGVGGAPTGTYGALSIFGSGISLKDDYSGKIEIGRYSAAFPNAYIKLGANANSLKITNNTDSADLVTILNTGNIGIGISSPGRLLSLYKSSTPILQFIDAVSGTASNNGFLIYNSGLDAYLENTSNGFMSFSNNGAERMRITANNSVLINRSTNPYESTYRFIVKNTTDVNVGFGIQEGEASIESFNDAISSPRPLRLYGSKFPMLGGDVIVGATSSAYNSANRGNISVNGTSNAIFGLMVGGTAKGYYYHGGTHLYINNDENGGNIYATAYSGGVVLNGGATSWTSASDERLKNITGNIDNAINSIMTLRTIKHTWKSDKTNKEHLSLIAQDVEKVFPQVIDKNVLPSKPNEEQLDETEYLGVRYTELIPVLVAAIQEQQAQIEELKLLIATK